MNSKGVIACVRCKRRKRKCDAAFPRCSLCVSANAQCLQDNLVAGRELPRDYVVQLEQQNLELRQTVAQQREMIESINVAVKRENSENIRNIPNSNINSTNSTTSVSISNPINPKPPAVCSPAEQLIHKAFSTADSVTDAALNVQPSPGAARQPQIRQETEFQFMQRVSSAIERSIAGSKESQSAQSSDLGISMEEIANHDGSVYKSLETEITEPGERIINSTNRVDKRGQTQLESQNGISAVSSLLATPHSPTFLFRYLRHLPDQPQALQLVEVYFELEYPIFPILTMAEFLPRLGNVYRVKAELEAHVGNSGSAGTSGTSEYSDGCLGDLYFVFLVLALTCANLESRAGAELELRRDAFLAVAEEISRRCFHKLSLSEQLQALILLGQTALCRPCFPGLWNIATLLCSMVVKLKLYDERKLSGGSDVERRIFWSSYLLDRYICLCIARPHLIDEGCITAKYFVVPNIHPRPSGHVPLPTRAAPTPRLARLEELTVETQKYSLLYLQFCRIISEIKELLFSARVAQSELVRVVAQGPVNMSEAVAQCRVALKARLDAVHADAGALHAELSHRTDFSPHYLTLLYLQSVCLLYKPNMWVAEPPAEDYAVLHDVTGRIIGIFAELAREARLTYRLLSVSSVFIACILNNYSIFKCEAVAQQAEVAHIRANQETCISILRQSPSSETVEVCCGVVTKLSDAVVAHVAHVAQSKAQNQNLATELHESGLTINIDDERMFFDVDFNLDSAFNLIASFEDVAWDNSWA